MRFGQSPPSAREEFGVLWLLRFGSPVFPYLLVFLVHSASVLSSLWSSAFCLLPRSLACPSLGLPLLRHCSRRFCLPSVQSFANAFGGCCAFLPVFIRLKRCVGGFGQLISLFQGYELFHCVWRVLHFSVCLHPAQALRCRIRPADFVVSRMQHVLLKNITPVSQHWTIRTRAVRFSRYLSNDEPPKTLRLDLILLDEEGTAIEGQVPEMWVSTFEPILKEDHVYYIKYFQVRGARAGYRLVDHPYQIRFTAHTTLHEVNPVPDTFPLYAHAAVPFDVLRSRNNRTDFTSDVIGVFTGCTHVKNQGTKDGPKLLRNIFITDGRETASVALWRNHAVEFEAEKYLELAQKRPIVFLFCGVTCWIYDDKLSLQGSTMCRWYANPLLPEVAALQDSCIGRLPPATWIGPEMGANEPQKITVTELTAFKNPHIIFNNRYIITTKIKNIANDQSWWYHGCKYCKRSVQQQGTGYKCLNPKCNSTEGGPRYKLLLMATDPETPEQGVAELPAVELLFLGSIAEEHIGVPADTLIGSGGGIGAFLPTRITALYGKVYTLRVSVSIGSLQRTNITYQVDGIIKVGNIVPPQQQLGAAPSIVHPVAATSPQVPAIESQSDLTHSPVPSSSSVQPAIITEQSSSKTPAPPATPSEEQEVQVTENTKTGRKRAASPSTADTVADDTDTTKEQSTKRKLDMDKVSTTE